MKDGKAPTLEQVRAGVVWWWLRGSDRRWKATEVNITSEVLWMHDSQGNAQPVAEGGQWGGPCLGMPPEGFGDV